MACASRPRRRRRRDAVLKQEVSSNARGNLARNIGGQKLQSLSIFVNARSPGGLNLYQAD